MSPQPSNRALLVEGTLRCLERLPPERVTARVIAEESGANLASITYHFGSKDDLVTEAVISGLDRWLAEVGNVMTGLPPQARQDRFRQASDAIEASRRRHSGLAANFVAALARAQHNAEIRERLVEGFRRTRPSVAALLLLGDDQAGEDAAGLVLALFYGLLFQTVLDPSLAIEGERLDRAEVRLRTALPGSDND
ncbi:MAG: TetR/AcrR family transcriptional regulator [Jiangellaceae bacterium]